MTLNLNQMKVAARPCFNYLPKAREKINWKPITDRSAEAIEELDSYAMHRKVETDYKILASGCKAVGSKLRTAQRNHATRHRTRR